MVAKLPLFTGGKQGTRQTVCTGQGPVIPSISDQVPGFRVIAERTVCCSGLEARGAGVSGKGRDRGYWGCSGMCVSVCMCENTHNVS